MGKPTNIKTDDRVSLDVAKVRQMRKLRWVSGWTTIDLAEKFDVTQGNISAIVNGNTWKHVSFRPGEHPETLPEGCFIETAEAEKTRHQAEAAAAKAAAEAEKLRLANRDKARELKAQLALLVKPRGPRKAKDEVAEAA